MKFKLCAAIVACFINVFTSAAQVKNSTDAHLAGHIVDAETKEHIPYASITLKGTNISGATDASGHFFLKNLPVGEYIIVASFVGYESAEKVVRIESRKTVEVDFDLKLQALNMDEVVVTGSRSETNRRESSTIVNVLSSRILESTAATCPAEALNFQSGLRVEQTCSNCGVPQLRINGLEGQYSQILLDSRPIFSSLASVYGLEQLPAGMIERIEVIRGGGSALFGSSAIGGVVNIITKEPLYNTVTLSNITGVFGDDKVESNTTLNGAFVTDDYKAGVYVFGMVKSKDSYDRNDDGFSDSPKLNSETVGFRGYYKISPYSKIMAEYHHIREFRRGGDVIDLPPHEADIAEQLRHSINGGGLKYDLFTPSYKHNVSLYTSVQKVDRESYFGTAKDLNAYGSTKDLTFIGGGQYIYKFDKLLLAPSDLTFGAEYTYDKLDDEMLGHSIKLDQTSICYGSFLQNEWKSDRVNVLIGGRLDKHSKIGKPILSPRANIRYTPIKEVGLRASYSSGYRAPQAYDEDLHVEAVGGNVAIITLDPDLKPEYSNSLSASIDLFKSFGRVQANLLVEGFYTNLKDVFVLVSDGKDANGNLIKERRNGLGAIVQGVNFEAKLAFTTKLSVDAGYTFQNSRYKEPEKWSDNPNIIPGKKMFRTPDQYGYLTVSYKPTKALSFTMSGNYTGSMLAQHFIRDYDALNDTEIVRDTEKITPSFFDMGIRVAYDISLSSQVKLQLSGGVKNAFDQFQDDIDKGKDKDAGYIYGPAMPRMYYFGVKFSM